MVFETALRLLCWKDAVCFVLVLLSTRFSSFDFSWLLESHRQEFLDTKGDENTPQSQPHPFPCRYCHKPFYSRWGRSRHEKLHTGKALNCPTCHQIYPTNYALQRHMSIHENHWWPLLFSCRTLPLEILWTIVTEITTPVMELQTNHKGCCLHQQLLVNFCSLKIGPRNKIYLDKLFAVIDVWECPLSSGGEGCKCLETSLHRL